MGKKLQNFANPEVRPTKSIMRESIFNFLSFSTKNLEFVNASPSEF